MLSRPLAVRHSTHLLGKGQRDTFIRSNASLSVVMVSPTCSFPISPRRIRSLKTPAPCSFLNPPTPIYLLHRQRSVMRLNKAYYAPCLHSGHPWIPLCFLEALVLALMCPNHESRPPSSGIDNYRKQLLPNMWLCRFYLLDMRDPVHAIHTIPTTSASLYAWALTLLTGAFIL